MSLVLYTLAALCMLVGLAGTVLPVIPGLPLMFAGMLLAAWTGGFAQVGLWPLSLLGLLTVFAVLMDFWVTALGAQKVGASKKAVMGAALGALADFFFAPWGVFIGPFAGAAIGELLHQDSLGQAARVGFGTWMGLLFGALLKLALACTMLAIFALAWLF